MTQNATSPGVGPAGPGVPQRALRADAAPALAAANEPGVALTKWLQRYTEFVGTKRGLAAALHSGDPAFDPAWLLHAAEANADLVVLARSGDADAFRVLVSRYRAMAMSVALHLSGDREAAEDLVQEATLAAFVCLGRPRDPDRFRSWFYGTVKKWKDR